MIRCDNIMHTTLLLQVCCYVAAYVQHAPDGAHPPGPPSPQPSHPPGTTAEQRETVGRTSSTITSNTIVDGKIYSFSMSCTSRLIDPYSVSEKVRGHRLHLHSEHWSSVRLIIRFIVISHHKGPAPPISQFGHTTSCLCQTYSIDIASVYVVFKKKNVSHINGHDKIIVISIMYKHHVVC